MPYVITNPSSLTRADKQAKLSFPKGKTTISDEEFERTKASKMLGAMLREGLLRAEKAKEPRVKEQPAPAKKVEPKPAPKPEV